MSERNRKDEANSGVEAVERALRLLDVFGPTDQGLSLKEVSERSGINKATILRLSFSLEKYGHITRDGEGLFHLGPALWRLGSVFRQSLRLGPIIRPILSQLVDITNESASFYVKRGDTGVCLYRVNSSRLARDHVQEGEVIPLNVGSSGRVLDAYSTMTGKNAEQIRNTGFYLSLGERDPDVAGMSVPVLSPEDELIGAVSLSGLRSRFDEESVEKHRVAVFDAVRKIQTKLGDK